jgi:hypothetical protein
MQYSGFWVMGVLAFGAVPAFACEAHATERVEHYEAKTPETMEEASKIYHNAWQAIQQRLEKDTLTPADMEAIHEQSYALEAAMQKFQQDLQLQADAVEALHLASEAHDEMNSRAEFKKLKPTAE